MVKIGVARMIEGGFILQPRIIKGSDIAFSAPHVREIWAYLLREANHADGKSNGYPVKRGQLFRTYKEIRDDLCWFAGYRKMTYSEDKTKKAMAALRKHGRIASAKAPRGVLVTICKYDYYQNQKNYKQLTEGTNESTAAAPMRHQHGPSINKNGKKNKNEKKKEYYPLTPFSEKWFADVRFKEAWDGWLEMRDKHQKHSYPTQRSSDLALTKLIDISRSRMNTAINIIDQSTMGGWATFWDLKKSTDQAQQPISTAKKGR